MERISYPVYGLPRILANLTKLQDYCTSNNLELLSKLEIHRALNALGYNGMVNGAARSFLNSAEQFGLLKSNFSEKYLTLLSPAKELLENQHDSQKLSELFLIILKNCKLFSDLSIHFLNSLKVELHLLIEAAQLYGLNYNKSCVAAKAYYDTILYIRNNLKEKPRFSIACSDDTKIVIQYPASYDREFLEDELAKILNKLKF